MNPTITTWLLLAISRWSAPDVSESQRARVADLVTTVVYDPDEPPLYQGPTGRALTAIELVSIASLESRFEERIMLGDCRRWECDHGRATGLLQVHLGPHGMRLVGLKAEQCSRRTVDCLTWEDLVADPSLQVRTGLHVLRTQGFTAFSPHLAARAQAAAFVSRHPVPVGDGEVMSVGNR